MKNNINHAGHYHVSISNRNAHTVKFSATFWIEDRTAAAQAYENAVKNAEKGDVVEMTRTTYATPYRPYTVYDEIIASKWF